MASMSQIAKQAAAVANRKFNRTPPTPTTCKKKLKSFQYGLDEKAPLKIFEKSTSTSTGVSSFDEGERIYHKPPIPKPRKKAVRNHKSSTEEENWPKTCRPSKPCCYERCLRCDISHGQKVKKINLREEYIKKQNSLREERERQKKHENAVNEVMKKRERQLLERIKKMEELNEIKNRQMKEIERLKNELKRTGDSSKPTVKSTSRSLRPGCPRSKSHHLMHILRHIFKKMNRVFSILDEKFFFFFCIFRG